MRPLYLALAATLVAAPAAAQQPSALSPFVNLNAGLQPQSQDLTQRSTFQIYDEGGSIEAPHSIEGSAFFDISAGVRVWTQLSVGAAYTAGIKDSRDVTVTAMVPSPIFTDTFRTATTTASGLEHTEQAFHLQALWTIPVTVALDVTLFGGPTFFTVKEDLISGVDISEVGGDFSNVNLENVSTGRQSHRTTGYNLGIDARYMFMRNVGAGAMLRYSRGSVDLDPPISGSEEQLSVDAGGFQIGAGLRFRF